MIRGTPLEKPVERIILTDLKHARQVAEALRLSLFRYGLYDPFLPCEEPLSGAPPPALNGRAEEIEYYLDPETGRYACRSAEKNGDHERPRAETHRLI